MVDSIETHCLSDTIVLMHLWTHRDYGRSHKASTGSEQSGSQNWKRLWAPTSNQKAIWNW